MPDQSEIDTNRSGCPAFSAALKQRAVLVEALAEVCDLFPAFSVSNSFRLKLT
jgi:hypothetical protein